MVSMQQPFARSLIPAEHDRAPSSVELCRDSAAHTFPANTVEAGEPFSKDCMAAKLLGSLLACHNCPIVLVNFRLSDSRKAAVAVVVAQDPA